MFRLKRNRQGSQPEAADQQPQEQQQSQPQPQPQMSPNGYMRVEMPTFHGRTRKVVVYSTDAQGRIIKTFKK